jgi:hypothetical protein
MVPLAILGIDGRVILKLIFNKQVWEYKRQIYLYQVWSRCCSLWTEYWIFGFNEWLKILILTDRLSAPPLHKLLERNSISTEQSIFLWKWFYCDTGTEITVTILDIIHHPVFYLKSTHRIDEWNKGLLIKSILHGCITAVGNKPRITRYKKSHQDEIQVHKHTHALNNQS